MSPEQSGPGDDRPDVDPPRSAFSFGGGEGAAYFGSDAPGSGAGAGRSAPGPKRSAPGREIPGGGRPGGGRRGRRRRAPLLAGALGLLVCAGAAIVVLAGGSGASSGSGGGGVSSTGSAPVSLARAAYVTSQAPGFQFQMNVEAKLGEHDLSLTGEGAIDERTLEGSISMSVAGQKLNELIKNPYAYIQLPPGAGAAIAGGKPWVRVDLAAFTQAAGAPSPFQGDTSRPAQTLSLLDASGDVTTVGGEDVRGVPTTHYHALLDAARLDSSASSAAARRYAEALEKLTGSDSLPVDVWIDAHGRVRRFSLGLQAQTPGGPLNETVSMELFDFGPQSQIAVPAESEVTDVTGALASQASGALQRLGG